eukprot:7405761-Ditylum_brightwellii.AAC.2
MRKKESKETDKTREDGIVGAHNDSFVSCMQEMVQNLDDAELDKLFFWLAEDFPQTYFMHPFIRTQSCFMLQPCLVEDTASCMPLDMTIWYSEELQEVSVMCKGIIAERLKENGGITYSVKSKATYGKLVDQILRFNGNIKQAAEWLFEDPDTVDSAVKRNMEANQHQEGAEAERNSEM